uniref:Secreted protein n=1 Tax=Ascaris lumbricoides TaxID=6252 RepID=A0A0M3INX5_ASCLU
MCAAYHLDVYLLPGKYTLNMGCAFPFAQLLLLLMVIDLVSARMETIKYMSDPVKLLINKVNAQTQMAIPAYKKLLANKSLRNGRSSKRKLLTSLRRPMNSYLFSSPLFDLESSLSRRRPANIPPSLT